MDFKHLLRFGVCCNAHSSTVHEAFMACILTETGKMLWIGWRYAGLMLVVHQIPA